MNRSALTHTANDNDPRDARPNGDAVGFRAMLREQEMERRLHALELHQVMQGNSQMQVQSQVTEAQTINSKSGVMTALFCALLATLAAAYCFYSGQSLVLCVAAVGAMVFSTLWAGFLSAKTIKRPANQQKNSSLISQVSIVVATIAGLAIWVLASREWGAPLSASDGAAGFAIITTLAAALLHSRLTLLMSACAGLGWLALYILMPSINMVSIWTYPLLALIQLVIAGQNDAKLPAFLTLIGAHGWLFWILNERMMAGDISPLHIAAFSMLIGMAHYRLGKAAGDVFWDSATLHVVFGWALAITGAIGLQHFWLGANQVIWQDLAAHPLGQLSWQIVGGMCIALIGIAGLIRMSHRQMSSLAVLFSLGVALAAAAIFDQRETIAGFIQTEMNMSAKPLVGLLIGAAIFASAAAMCINGARRQSMLMMLAGLTVIAVELALLLDPRLWNAETGFVFGIGLIASFCLAALFATETPAKHAH